MKKLLIRASSLGKIMSDSPKSKLTEKQSITLNELLSKIKLTNKQAELRDALLLKRDAKPELSKGGKSYIKELWLENNYGIKQELNNKYIDKGNEVERLSIKLAELTMDIGELNKNQEHFKNNFVCGTPDVITKDYVIDIKSSWSAATFPFFEEKITNNIYLWQLKAYMWLTNINKAYLSYCLVSTPEILIQDEIKRVSWKKGEIEISDQTEDQVREFHNLDKIPITERVKNFQVNLTKLDIENMKEKVKLAREYYNNLKQKL